MKRLSVVVTNYNYEKYVATAIDSALAVRWPDVEVVVVDDGSTDGSLEAIRAFGDKIILRATSNNKQREAANCGFAMSTGDVVVFLDSDDVLPPDLAERLDAVWSDGVSKAQFRMQRIDRLGAPIGDPFPAYKRVPTSQQIRGWFRATSAYPTPPGSGNAYARWFLEKIMPAGSLVGDSADSACLAAAPILGDVLTVPEVVVSYRQHGENDSNLLRDVSRFSREVERAHSRWVYASKMSGEALDERPLFRSRELLQLRVTAYRSDGSRPLDGDGPLRMALDALRSPFVPGPESVPKRLLIAILSLSILCAPYPLLARILRARYGQA